MRNTAHNSRLDWRRRYRVEERGHAPNGVPSPCWVWQGARSAGTGHVRIDGRVTTAHRLFYEERFGPVPADAWVYHLCRTRACVNPAHLGVGTSVEVGNESYKRVSTKLSEGEAAAIRTLLAEGSSTQQEIARRFGVSQTTVSQIKNGKTWKGAKG